MDGFEFRGLSSRLVIRSLLPSGDSFDTDITQHASVVGGGGSMSSSRYRTLMIPFNGGIEQLVDQNTDDIEFKTGQSLR